MPSLPKIAESSISNQAPPKTKVTSTPLVRPSEAAAQIKQQTTSAVNNAKGIRKQDLDEHDDDDDVRSGVNQPVAAQKPKPSNELPTPSVQSQATGDAAKELTPKEKMLLNKMKKADEIGAKLG